MDADSNPASGMNYLQQSPLGKSFAPWLPSPTRHVNKVEEYQVAGSGFRLFKSFGSCVNKLNAYGHEAVKKTISR
ncbi:hypothetical protein ATS72_017035 [Pseudoalteromonas sp. 13-15]|nr:hypothetical protein ATS72_017035 [Pseudoalteromonas sp. 13-15]